MSFKPTLANVRLSCMVFSKDMLLEKTNGPCYTSDYEAHELSKSLELGSRLLCLPHVLVENRNGTLNQLADPRVNIISLQYFRNK